MCLKPIQLRSMPAGERVPCGFCFECRARYRRGWAVRCLHEASLHEQNVYGTLTYAPEHLPPNGSLVKRDHQLYLKKLRQAIAPRRIKYYLAGEYGERNHRPHYHFLVFGFRPVDLSPLDGQSPFPLFRSRSMEELWPVGMSAFGDVSLASASYVAGYVMKKVDQVGRKKKYSCDPVTGVLNEIQAEYAAMSRGGRTGRGLGHGWYAKYGEEVERRGTVRADFKEVMPPRYYDQLLREKDPKAYEAVKWRRAGSQEEREQSVFLAGLEVESEEKREALARDALLRGRADLHERRAL